MREFGELAESLAGEVIEEVQAALGDDYDSLTDEQKESIRWTAEKVLELRIRVKTGEVGAEEKLEAVESTVQDWKVWGEIGADAAFWKGVQVVAETLGSFLAGAGRGLIPGL